MHVAEQIASGHLVLDIVEIFPTLFSLHRNALGACNRTGASLSICKMELCFASEIHCIIPSHSHIQ